MCYKAKIMLDQKVFGMKISFFIFQQIIFFLRKWTKVSKKPSNAYLEEVFYIVYVRNGVSVLFQRERIS